MFLRLEECYRGNKEDYWVNEVSYLGYEDSHPSQKNR